MEITIGVKDVNRQLTLEVDGEAKDVLKAVTEALEEQAKGNSAAASLGYVEIGAQTPRPVGFGTN